MHVSARSDSAAGKRAEKREPAAPSTSRSYLAPALITVRDIPYTPLRASLSLSFERDGDTTRLVGRDHFGPLLVQKPFYPEGREVCQAVIIHPPGGVVGGDQLQVTARVGNAASAQLATPGAAKWYKSNGHVSHQNVMLEVGPGGSLEWFPQETIFFDNVNVELEHDVALGKDASYIGCEILCFGRTASGESFSGGEIRQRIGIRREGKLIWYEQLRLSGGSPAMRSPLLLAGSTVCATLVAVGQTASAAALEMARESATVIAGPGGQAGISQLKGLVVARYLGNSSQAARRVMLDVWSHLRPVMLGRKAVVPRVWNT